MRLQLKPPYKMASTGKQGRIASLSGENATTTLALLNVTTHGRRRAKLKNVRIILETEAPGIASCTDCLHTSTKLDHSRQL